jgi:hypothetical protein
MFDYANTLLEKGGYDNLTAEERTNIDECATTELRRIRDGLLQETDKYAVSDFPMSDDERTAMTQYRQELRDLPTTQNPRFQEDGGQILRDVTFPSSTFVTDEVFYRYAPFTSAQLNA